MKPAGKEALLSRAWRALANIWRTAVLVMGRAVKGLHATWQTSVLVVLGAGILGIIWHVLETLIPKTFFLARITSLEQIREYIINTYHSRGLLIPLFRLLDLLIAPVLGLGMYAYFLSLYRGGEARFSLLFSRRRLFLKVLGQAAVMLLIIFGWALLILVPLSLLPFLFRMRVWIYIALLAAGTALLIFIGLRYAMAPWVMADEPETGIITSIRKSKALMRGQKAWFFFLILILVLCSYLAAIAEYLLTEVFGPLGLIPGEIISLAANTFIYAVLTAFYLYLADPSPDAKPQADAI